MNRDVIFVWCRSESERVPLPVRDLRAVAVRFVRLSVLPFERPRRSNSQNSQEDVLSCPRLNLFLLNLNLTNIARMQNDLTNEGAMPRTNFSKDAFVDVESSSEDPILPENSDLSRVAVGWSIGSVMRDKPSVSFGESLSERAYLMRQNIFMKPERQKMKRKRQYKLDVPHEVAS